MSRETMRRHLGLAYRSAGNPERAKALLALWIVSAVGTLAFYALGALSSAFDLAWYEALYPPAIVAVSSDATVRSEY